MRRLLLFITLILCLTACSQNNEPEAELTMQKELTITVCYDYFYMDQAVSLFKEIYPDAIITVNKFDNDYEKYSSHISTSLMAGTSGDVFASHGIDVMKQSESGLLADFYKLMNNDKDYNPDDYITNVFKGMEYKNKLYDFPTCFDFSQVGVNNMFSEQLVSAFGTYDTVSNKDLLDLYLSFDDTNGLFISENFDAFYAVVLDNYIDYENKTCNFNNPDFIRLIEDAKTATEPGKQIGMFMSSNMSFPSNDSDRSKKYLFADIIGNNYQYFLNIQEYGYFVDFKPVANNSGQIKIDTAKSFCIAEKSQNKAFAWEFIKFLTSLEANSNTFVPGLPVKKEVYDVAITQEISNTIKWITSEGMHLIGEEEQAITQAKEYFDTLTNTPMTYPRTPTSIIMLFYEEIQMFTNGTMTAEQVAADLQNKISLALLE